MVKKKGFIVLL